MRFLKKYKFQLILVCIVLSMLLIYHHYGFSFIYKIINNNSTEAKQYLRSNFIEIKNMDSFNSMPSLDSNVAKHQLFFIGEEHGVGINQDIEFMFLKYFKEKGDVKYLILEFPHTFSTKINQYITSGDTTYLDSAFCHLKGTFAWTKEFVNFFKDIHSFNNSFRETDKIKCIGIDVEHQSGTAIDFLKTLLPGTIVPNEISSIVSKLQKIKLNKSDFKSGWSIANELMVDFNKKSDIYHNYLGDNYFEYKLILNNIINGQMVNVTKKEKGQKAYVTMRDSIMYGNLMLFHQDFPDEKAFGFFGHSHVFRYEFFNTNYLASLLEKNGSPYGGKVLSIFINYQQCKKIKRPKYNVSRFNGPIQNKIFDFYDGDSPTLYYLDEEESPFQTFRFYPLYKCGTAKLFQYILLIKKSGPSTPIN